MNEKPKVYANLKHRSEPQNYFMVSYTLECNFSATDVHFYVTTQHLIIISCGDTR